MGYIVLRELPGTKLTIDGVVLRIQPGFRGFHNVPAGEHTITVEDSKRNLVSFSVKMADGDVIVRIFEQNKFVDLDLDGLAQIQQITKTGKMDHMLRPYPTQKKKAAA